jgi:nitrate/nitrite-specific signal transduction histidine kinase
MSCCRPTRLQTEVAERQAAEGRVRAQLTRLNLLHQITRSIGERQDLRSIFQVVIRSLEDQLPVDFGAICLYQDGELVVSGVGVRSYELSMALAMGEAARIAIDQNGLSRCVAGNWCTSRTSAQSRFRSRSGWRMAGWHRWCWRRCWPKARCSAC